jgi:hypothetical protein
MVDNISNGSHQDRNKLQPRRSTHKGSAHCTEKSSSEGKATNLYTFIADTTKHNSEVCLSANQNTTWVLDSRVTDHLVKEDTPVLNKYELSIPPKIHIAKNNNYLLAYVKGDIIAEVRGSVKCFVFSLQYTYILFIRLWAQTHNVELLSYYTRKVA